MQEKRIALPVLVVRGVVGGVLMGLANLVPGISGGTMLLAAGVYPRFIDAIAEITTMKFRPPSLAVLGSVVVAAMAGILLFAGTVKGLVVDRRWIMYSLFIGLTLGGIPIVWRQIRGATRATWTGAFCGFAGMACLAFQQQHGAAGGAGGAESMAMLFLAGVAGASAMILPGVSGGYLLLVMGQYLPILGAIDDFKTALGAGEFSDGLAIALRVGAPVGLGVVLGIVGVSNLLKILMNRFPKAILGVLLGLLVGAVVGLWPFQETTEPRLGETIKGRVVTEAMRAELDPDDYPTRYFHPSARHVGGAAGLILAGFVFTYAVSRFGREED